MSTTTSNLGLFKYDTTADANTAFSIDTALNNNWDTLDSTIGNIETTISGLDPSDKVSKSGDTMTGNLTINKSTPKAVLQDNGITKGTTPSSNKSSSLSYIDSAGSNTSAVISGYTTAGVIYTGLYAYQPVSGSTTSSRIAIYYPKTGDPYTYAPPSASTNSILTTTGISKASNGYLKLGNGIIFQWGNSSNGSGTITQSLSLSYSNKTYIITTAVLDTSNNNAYTPVIKSRAVGSFDYALNSTYTNVLFLTVGY